MLNHLPKPVLVTELPTVRAGFSRGTAAVQPAQQGYSHFPCPLHPQLLSLLLEALSCSDRVVQLSTLSCLQPLLLEAPQIMSLHIDTLVTKFLSLTSSPTMVRTTLSATPTPLLCPSPFHPSILSLSGCSHCCPALCPCTHQPAHNSGKCSCFLLFFVQVGPSSGWGSQHPGGLLLRAVVVL